MQPADRFLESRLTALRKAGNYRALPGERKGVDFWSNDYLGLSRLLPSHSGLARIAPGSRLISGNSPRIVELEERIAAFHGQPSALLFTSGYAANSGLISCLGRRTDTIVYDALVHASIRDGIRLSNARAIKFDHNDPASAARGLNRARPDGQTFLLTEARFSMDGDCAPLEALGELCRSGGAHLIVDEAHSIGINGNGKGLVAQYGAQDDTFATVVTFGKAMGGAGAAVLGSKELKQYLVNTCRPFIFTTGPRPTQIAEIAASYRLLEDQGPQLLPQLWKVIEHYQACITSAGIATVSPANDGPIQTISVPGAERVMAIERKLVERGFLVKAIRSPTVAVGRERLRISLHAFNTRREVDHLIKQLNGLL